MRERERKYNKYKENGGTRLSQNNVATLIIIITLNNSNTARRDVKLINWDDVNMKIK